MPVVRHQAVASCHLRLCCVWERVVLAVMDSLVLVRRFAEGGSRWLQLGLAAPVAVMVV